MELKELFAQAVENSKTLTERPSNEILLKLYSLYKQAEKGDAGNEGPDNPFDYVGMAKFNAWVSQRGKSKEIAMQEYIDLVNQLLTS
jgi:diazepam-binding inhibitor (GABA receptor modulating acyl-CoA-binding protein)